jgi:hypothetical protein
VSETLRPPLTPKEIWLAALVGLIAADYPHDKIVERASRLSVRIIEDLDRIAQK